MAFSRLKATTLTALVLCCIAIVSTLNTTSTFAATARYQLTSDSSKVILTYDNNQYDINKVPGKNNLYSGSVIVQEANKLISQKCLLSINVSLQEDKPSFLTASLAMSSFVAGLPAQGSLKACPPSSLGYNDILGEHQYIMFENPGGDNGITGGDVSVTAYHTQKNPPEEMAVTVYSGSTGFSLVQTSKKINWSGSVGKALINNIEDGAKIKLCLNKNLSGNSVDKPPCKEFTKKAKEVGKVVFGSSETAYNEDGKKVQVTVKFTTTEENRSSVYGPFQVAIYNSDKEVVAQMSSESLSIGEEKNTTLEQNLSVSITFDGIEPGKYTACTINGDNQCSTEFEKKVNAKANTSITLSKKQSSSFKEKPETSSSCAIDGIGWFVCPVMSFLGGVTNSLYSIISSMLTINASFVANDGPAKTGWESMKNIANVGLVIVFLIIILSQLTSFGISNYGIKKILPRLVVAAILVNISFIVCQLAIDLSNILGSSLNSLIKSIPVFPAGVQGFWSNGNAFSNAIIVILTGTGVVAGTVAIAAGVGVIGGIGLLFIIILSGLLAIAITFIIIAARMALAIILVVVSPLAFMAMVLPNTRNLYEKWQKMFIAVLAIYPMIAVVFGLSQLASNIIIQSATSKQNAGDPELMLFILGIGVAIVPLFASIPMLKGALNAVPGVGKFAQRFSGASPFKSSIRRGMKDVGGEVANMGRGAALSGKFGGKVQNFAAGRGRRRQRNQERASNIQRAETELTAQSILNDPNASDRAKAAALGAQKRLEDEEISNIMTLDKSRNMSPDDHLSRIHDSNSSEAEKLASISAIEKEGGQAMVNKMLASSSANLPLSARQAMGAVAASKSQNNPAFGGGAIRDITSGNFNASQAYTNYAASSEFNAQRLLDMHGTSRTEMLNALSGVDSNGNAIPNFKPNAAAIEALRNAALQIDSNPEMKGKISAQARADIDQALARAKATSGVTSQPQPTATSGAPAPIVNRRPVQETMSDLPTPLVPPSRDTEGSLDIPRSPDS